jgi:hypothetical protein
MKLMGLKQAGAESSLLSKRYGFPICWALHTIPMANQHIENEKPSILE